MGFTVDFHAEEEKNVRKTFFLMFIFLLIMALFGLIIDIVFALFPIFTIVLLVVALIQVLISLKRGKQVVLRSLQARPLNAEDFDEKQLKNIVDELAIASGMAVPPEVYVIDNDKVLNAFATGSNRENSVVCVTTGLLKTLNREETSGVIAHELSHIINRDVLLMTVISSLLGAVVILKIFALRGLFSYLRFGAYRSVAGRRRSSKGSKGGDKSALAIIVFLAAVAALGTLFSFVGRLTLLAVSRTREYFADSRAVELTRNPYGLSSALRKIWSGSEKMTNASVATAHLFVSDPLKRKINNRTSFISNLFSTHPPIHSRIAILENRSEEDVKNELFALNK
ncbi:MAG TPA: peptidase M48 [Kosmotogaceae bacterium]|nr:MAG: Protease HtpX-like protein [Thermotogales bacterium 46_20]HAA85263.1 peptidase M48 [Kosmotogaceae bacterium]